MNTLYRLRLFRYFDWVTCTLMCAIALLGLAFVFSATYSTIQPFSLFFKKQLGGVVGGIFIYFFFCLIDHRTLMRWGYFGYIGVIGLLIFTLIKGSIGMGAQRWVHLVFFKLQPSELAKLLFPMFASHYLYTHKDNVNLSVYNFIPISLVLAISFVLILKQPDLGTALIVAFCGLIFMWFAGLPKKYFIILFTIAFIAAPLTWRYVLKPYQKRRITVFLGQGDSHKERYQIEQAAIAIGSGGLCGKGFLRGTQNKLRFLPEGRTDFIFAVLCEEWGFMGALACLLLYMLLFARIFTFIITIQAPCIQLLAIGAILHIILAVGINIGMVLSLLPIVGIPLPLMSYGITNLWVTFASFGLVQSITMRRE